MKRFALLLALLVLPCAAFAQEGAPPDHAKVLNLSNRWKVAEDFSAVQDVEMEVRILTEEGARREGRVALSYNKALASFELVRAETRKADGRRLPVPESGIARQSGSVGQATLRDQETVALAMPDLAPGDSVFVAYRVRHSPLLPGTFSFGYWPPSTVQQDNTELEVELPASWKPVIDSSFMTLERDEVQGGRRRLKWALLKSRSVRAGTDEADARLRLPHVWLSTMQDWDETAQRYAPLYATQGAVTPEIAALAARLVEGASEPREKARRLYDWVRKNIRYIAIYSGMESWVPHPAAQVLANGFGDCKDHAVLLDALLRAQGIANVPVLILADGVNFTLPTVAIPGQAFNHMISYLPELDLYLDSTSPFAEFGRLPDADQGKQVLRIGLAPARGRTPASPAAERVSARSSVLEIRADGSARQTTTAWFGGDYRTWFEQFRQELANGKDKAWATQEFITKQRRRGTATLTWLPEQDGRVGVRIVVNIENHLSDAEIGLLAFDHAFIGPASLFTSLDPFEKRSQSGKFVCRASSIDDKVEIRLPAGLELLRLPRDRDVNGRVASLKASYTDAGKGRYVMQRNFRWEPGRAALCEQDDWEAWQADMRKMRAAVRSAVLAYERN